MTTRKIEERVPIPPLTSPIGRQVTDASPWLIQYPELSTRPDLLALMKRNTKVRRAVLKKLSHLIYVPDIRENGAARHALNLVYSQGRRELVKYWQERMDEAGLHKEMAQMVGVLRNVYMNMCYEIDPTKCRTLKWGRWDVTWEERGDKDWRKWGP